MNNLYIEEICAGGFSELSVSVEADKIKQFQDSKNGLYMIYSKVVLLWQCAVAC